MIKLPVCLLLWTPEFIKTLDYNTLQRIISEMARIDRDLYCYLTSGNVHPDYLSYNVSVEIHRVRHCLLERITYLHWLDETRATVSRKRRKLDLR